MMERQKDPNRGMMSPPGGKLDWENAESPSACAVREAFEECQIESEEKDWKLRGIVTEKNFPGAGNIMIFLMEYRKLLELLPPPCNEGKFYFIHPENFDKYNIPETDKKFFWEKIIEKSDEVFIQAIDCTNYPEIKLMNL